MKTIVLTAAAAKQLDALPAPARSAVEAALDLYALNGRGDVKKIQGRPGFRLRVGNYRVIFDETMTLILAVMSVGARRRPIPERPHATNDHHP